MLTMLKDWEGKVEVNGTEYDSMQIAISKNKKLSGNICIKLYPKGYKETMDFIERFHQEEVEDKTGEVVITVKPYMTKPATPEFDFMAKWNKNKPMPMRIMQGVKVKETPGMVYMKLHGLAKPTITCYCCGKELTNPISRHYGIGPICLTKMGITRDIEDVEGISEELVNIEWEGWVIRSAIIKEETVWQSTERKQSM